jgi:hypothetical protein
MLDQIAVDVLSSVVLVVIIILCACSEPQAYPTLSSQPAYTYTQVKRADKARLAGSMRSRNQGLCQAQDWIVEIKEDVSSWEDFLGTAYN